MQLSEDGNFMWNGTEWVPVEEQATATVEEVAVPPTPEVSSPAIMPQETSVQQLNTAPAMIAPVIIKPGATQKPAINMAAAFSVFKYGIIALAGWFVSMILLTIVWVLAFDMAFSSDSGTTGMIILIVAALVTIIAYGQMIILSLIHI